MSNRSDKGIHEFNLKFLKDILGLSEDTADRIMNLIKSKGELSTVRKHVRSLSGEVYNRLHKDMERVDKKNKDKKEGVAESSISGSFMKYLVELSTRDVARSELDSVGDRNARIDRAKLGDAQAIRARDEELRTMVKSKDPREQKIVLLRKQIAMLQDQIAKDKERQRNSGGAQ